MATFFTDFREYTPGDRSALGYLEYWYYPTNIFDDGYWYDVDTIDIDEGTGTEGDQYLRFRTNIDNYNILVWEWVGSQSGEVEVLAKVKFNGTMTNTINVGPAVCVGGSAGAEDGYFAYLNGYYGGGTGGLGLMKRLAGVQSDIGGDGTSGLVSNTWYWIRLLRDATHVRCS